MAWRGWMAAAAALAWAGAAQADEARERELAREVIELSGMQDMLSDMFRDLAPILASAIANDAGLSARDTERLGVILAEELEVATPQMIDAAISGYAEALEEPQLTEIRDFLASPTGRAMIASQQQIEETMGPMAERVGQDVATRAITRLFGEMGK